jgi:hypothetical protein
MTIYNFIKESVSLNGIPGDICSEIIKDKEYPKNASDIVQINYITKKALYHAHIKESLLELISSYRVNQNKNWIVMHKSNSPISLPDGFKIEKVLLKGMIHDYYKAYLIDSKKGRAIIIDLKLSYWRNKPKNIKAPEYDELVLYQEWFTPENAYDTLRQCKYNNVLKPDRETFENVLSLLSK